MDRLRDWLIVKLQRKNVNEIEETTQLDIWKVSKNIADAGISTNFEYY